MPRIASRRTTGGSSTSTSLRKAILRKGRRAATALFVVAVMLAPPASGSAPADDDRAAIQDLLDRRAEAVLSGDRAAFSATLTGAPAGSKRRQLRVFDHLGDLDLAAYELEADWGALGDLARPQDRAGYRGEQEIAIPVTHERYRLAGYDARLVHQDLYLTFVKVDGEWGVGGDDDLEDLGLYSQRNVWDFSPVRTERSRHFISIEPRCNGCPSSGGALLSVAEGSLEAVDRFWTRPWHRRVPLVAPASSDDLARIIQSTYPVGNYLAFAVWTGGANQNPGVRVIVNPDRFALASDGSGVLTHELTHVASLYSRGSFTPSVVDEGLAQYVGVQGDPAEIAEADASARSAPPRLPEDYEFFVGDPSAVFNSYQRSLSAVAYFVERWGFKRFQQFYATLGRASREPGTFRYQLDSALEETIGMDRREFERAWASSID